MEEILKLAEENHRKQKLQCEAIRDQNWKAAEEMVPLLMAWREAFDKIPGGPLHNAARFAVETVLGEVYFRRAEAIQPETGA